MTAFSGFGLVESGAKKKGYKAIAAIEYDPELADVYRVNHGDHVWVEDIRKSNPKKFERPDVFWASPSCKGFSDADARRGNKHHPDNALGLEVPRFIKYLKPPWVFIENVPKFYGTPAFTAIADCLNRLGYWVSYGVLDAADYGVPQYRKRLILTANRTKQYHIPQQSSCVSWYQQISDLIPNLATANLTPIQKNAIAGLSEPLLIERVGYYRSGPKIAKQGDRCWTLRASLADDRKSKGSRSQFINVVENGTTYNLDTRSFARLMTVPDDFWLPENIRVAITGLGNGVPCDFVSALLP